MPVSLTEKHHLLLLLSDWFKGNFQQINGDKTQAMILGNSTFEYSLKIYNNEIETKDSLKILGVTLDNNRAYKEHSEILKNVYAKIVAILAASEETTTRKHPCETIQDLCLTPSRVL